MQIFELFKKDINRNIQGVVKIGQDSPEVIRSELDEYVVTKELNRHFDKFFEAYRKGTTGRTDKIGVWISGFFGSGKSHFLKILSYILSGKEYEGGKAVKFFDEKITDGRILADMKAAGDISADVILFNIDAKSDSDSKTNKDAIVKVFMKVFNEMQGFCGSMPWIADLERQMTKDGTYDAFRAKFEEINGATWEKKREDFYFEEDSIIEALAATTKMSLDAARSWYEKSEKNYALDISTFAKKVREYIELRDKQLGKKHHVIFLCDEIGQYIGSDSNLMLNLQTVVENLGSECGGRAWVIATSQEDISKIVNETKSSRDDFSKIIGRFDTRLSLSSANVDEVIKKRLLSKTVTATEKLRLLYTDKNAILKNLITFSPDTPEKKLYQDEQDFVDVYPFIPYQFSLLQAVFTGIRTHGASGKHLSEGERSLLNAFQEAAIQYAKFSDGMLIPFDAFYRTIETFLDHNIRKVIIQAETNEHLVAEDDLPVLKTLFLVKYIPNVLPSNLENLATVMLDNINADKIEMKKRVDASLRRLEREKLITKNGEQFIFLTDEEQDVNREIREIAIDHAEIIEKAADEIQSEIFKTERKYRYDERHDFAYNFNIDDRPRGNQSAEMGLRILTPWYISGGLSDMEFTSMSMRERNIIMVLPSDPSFLEEMEQALQIDTYIRRNSGRSATDAVEDIKTTKARESKQRKDRCRELIVEALKRASVYVNGNRIEIKEKSPTERVNEAFATQVESIFTKLNYIKKPFYSTEDLKQTLAAKSGQIILDGTENADPNALAIEEMGDVIKTSSYKNVPTTLRIIADAFGKSPYGWKDIDVAGILLTLFKMQDIRFELRGESIASTDTNVITYVSKRDYADSLIIKMRVKIPDEMLALAKTLAKEVFGRADMPNDEDGIKEKIINFCKNELTERNDSIKDLLNEYNKQRYPGKSVLEKGKGLLEEVARARDVQTFYETLRDKKEALLDYAEDVQDIKKFFTNQRDIFDKALKMLDIYEGNRSYVLDADTIATVTSMEKITKLTSPYAEIHKLPEFIQEFISRFGKILQDECVPIQADIEADHAVVRAEVANHHYEEKFGEKVRVAFAGLLNRLGKANNIYEAIAMKTESDRLKLRLIKEINDEEARIAAENAKSGDEPFIPQPKTKTISVKSLFPRAKQVANHEDIEQLLGELRDKLEAQLEENTTIQIV
ncbi:MAG: hypothetical protein A2Y17_13400 [Clostridiales bacterium GWF2_38_85]|nr:MAG: hypothetical protein A2Y17_13400 [Clostridiales bacterium GWF2_38_85]